MGGIARTATSANNDCPYCGMNRFGIATHHLAYTSLKCMECSSFYRSFTPLEKQISYPLLRVSKSIISVNYLMQERLELKEGDLIDIQISSKDGVTLAKTDFGLRLAVKDKTSFNKDLIIQSMDLAIVLREECGILDTSPVNLYLNENNKIMGFLLKSDIKGVAAEKQGIPLDLFLSIRQSGATSISAALRDTLEIGLGHRLYFYEKEGKLFIMNNKKNTDLPIDEGFNCVLQGQKGFSNYFSISSVKFAAHLSRFFNIPIGTKFRIRCSEIQEIDGYEMVEVLSIL